MDYDARFLATAARMLAPKSRGGKGQEVVLHEPGSDGAFDPATETTTGATEPVDHDGSGVEDKFSAYSIASGVVEAKDVKFLLSPLKLDGGTMPTPVADSWTITMGGQPYTIKKVDPIRPAGTPVMFELQLRA